MVRCLYLRVCVSLCWAVAAAQILNLYEGNTCKQTEKGLWTCKHINNCRMIRRSLRGGKKPTAEICSFKGSIPVVCCEPDVTEPVTRRSKSQQMCRKYAEHVFLKLPKAFDEGYEVYDTCQSVEPLISGGINAEPREYPHMALIGYGEKSSIQWKCGGSLISERFVLSAAHCSDGGQRGFARWVRLGDYNFQSNADDDLGYAQSMEYEIIQRIVHPDYNSVVYNDIVLFKLNTIVEFNEFIRPICLQTDRQFPETNAIATGWGRNESGGLVSSILQKVNLTITPRKECSDTVKPGGHLKYGINYISMLCAGGGHLRKDTCQGDSGGPLQVRLKEPYCMYSQIGITSFGFRCAVNKPGVFTRVSYFVPWIESIVWP